MLKSIIMTSRKTVVLPGRRYVNVRLVSVKNIVKRCRNKHVWDKVNGQYESHLSQLNAKHQI